MVNTGKVNKATYKEILATLSDEELYEEGVKKIKVYQTGYQTNWWDDAIREEARRRGQKSIYQNAYNTAIRNWRKSL